MAVVGSLSGSFLTDDKSRKHLNLIYHDNLPRLPHAVAAVLLLVHDSKPAPPADAPPQLEPPPAGGSAPPWRSVRPVLGSARPPQHRLLREHCCRLHSGGDKSCAARSLSCAAGDRMAHMPPEKQANGLVAGTRRRILPQRQPVSLLQQRALSQGRVLGIPSQQRLTSQQRRGAPHSREIACSEKQSM